ncbi:helicase-exonuclease AddAB subunit AddA [Vagococcus elongatus]|nr:helicase-exonuclease AddAB subunit AddA [Vagococcus elongatus]
MSGKLPLKPEQSHFTDGQWQSIYDGGSNLLVSASAGSGKTTVLVQRVIEKIKSGVDIDQLLIATYTEAAAKEMKERILTAVQQAITEEQDVEQQRHLVNQISKIPAAPISTLHAFCLQVIRKYYYLIDIDPVFRLLTDETEMLLLKEDVWHELREELYGEQEEWFYPLTENFSGDRNDEGFSQLIYSLYEFSRANPEPKRWLDGLLALYQGEEQLADTMVYREFIRPNMLQVISERIEQGFSAVSSLEGEPELAKPLAILQDEVAILEQIYELISAEKLETCHEMLKQVEFQTYRGPGKKADDVIKEAFESTKAIRNQNKEYINEMKSGFFGIAPDAHLTILKRSKFYIKNLSEVADLFDKAYTAKKQEKKILDFNDLEHLTLRILRKKSGDDWEASEASSFYRKQFKEVLVDEYQDINQLQENILFWLRSPEKEDGNFFMVGDVKQSIYSFRLADPTLFIEKYNAFAKGEGGRRIVLAENFRSRGDVLAFTNFVFTQLMDVSVGQLDYDDQAKLVHGFKAFPKTDDFKTEVLIFENDGLENSEEDVSEDEVSEDFVIDDKTEGEIRIIGNKIRELKQNGFQVYDKKAKEMRPLAYRDIVILTPTKKNNLVILDILSELSIPLYVNDTQNYFQATEVKLVMALLNVIDNPYQDIPLAAVLRSPIVGLGENDMARIRLQRQAGNYYEALKSFSKMNTEKFSDEEKNLQKKIHYFEKQLAGWRELARRKQLVDLIWKIYQDTGLIDYVGGLPSGKQRQANLHALYERAMNYENSSFKGLFQFVRFIEKMQQKEKDLAEPSSIGEDEDAVRVMTIHASKGLEFPVVFIMDLNRRFNLKDLRQQYIFDEKLGAGIKYIEPLTRVEYESLPYQTIREEKRKKLLAEEMRKLYVGLTRAEEKLFLVASYKNEADTWKKWSKAAEIKTEVLSDQLRLGAQSLMDWLGMTLVRHENLKENMEEHVEDYQQKFDQSAVDFSVEFFDLDKIKQTEAEATTNAASIEKPEMVTNNQTVEEQQQLAESIKVLTFEYPYEVAAQTASYQSVSEIKRVFEDPDNTTLLPIEFVNGHGRIKHRFAEEKLATPKFLSETEEVSSADIGTATHVVLQLLTLAHPPTVEDIRNLISKLVTNHSIAQEVGEKIDAEHLQRFFETPFGSYLIANQKFVSREQPFSMLIPAKDIFEEFPEGIDDRLLVHGIIDGYIETSEDLILYDFKTDYLPENYIDADLNKIKQRYQGQLQLYKKALEAEKKRPVTEVKLILLQQHLVLEMT